MPDQRFLRTENYVRELLLIFFAQRTLILGVTAIIFAGALVIAFFSERRFQAEGAILLRGTAVQKSPQALEKTDLRSFPVTEEDLVSEKELLSSPAVIARAITRVRKNLAGKDDWTADLNLFKIRKKLQTEVVPVSRVVNITLEGNHPERVVRLLDAILQEYIIYRTEVHYPEDSVAFYKDQADRFAKELLDTEHEIMALVETTGTPVPSKEIEYNLIEKSKITEQLNRLRTDAVKLQELVEHLDIVLSGNELRHYAFLDNITVMQAANRLVDLRIERGKIARHYQDNSINVLRIDEQLNKTQQLLKKEILDIRDAKFSDLSAVQKSIITLQERLFAIDERNVQLKYQQVKTRKLEHQQDLLQNSHETFVKRWEEARMNSMVDSTFSSFFVSILSNAFSDGKPTFPNKKMLIVVGLAAGFLTGFSLGFLREFFDHTFKNSRDVEQFAGVPLLFSIPMMDLPAMPEENQEIWGVVNPDLNHFTASKDAEDDTNEKPLDKPKV